MDSRKRRSDGTSDEAPTMFRREYLGLVAVTTAGSFGGCISNPDNSSPESDPGDRGASSRETTGATSIPSARCRGEPASKRRSLTDLPGYTDDFEYFPSNDTVRVVEVRNGGEPVEYGEMSFTQWASQQSARAGAQKAASVSSARLGKDGITGVVGQPPASASTTENVIWIEVARSDATDTGETPSISLAELVAVGPRFVAVSVSLDDRTFTRDVPVFARVVEMEVM